MEWHIIPTGRVWMDTGGAFGLTPQPLWIEHQPVDEKHRIPMDLDGLLVISEGKKIIIDNGLGHKLSEKAERNFGLEYPEGTLVENLEKHGLTPADIDIVINTHLHSDHCGANTMLDGETVIPTFPNAEYWIQRLEFADAFHPDARTRGTYFADNFVPLWKAGKIRFLHGDTEVTSEVRTVMTRGHTRGHQSIILDDGSGVPVFFTADLSTYAVHFAKPSWVTAYDVEPLETITTKAKWQKWVLETNATLFFQHDSYTRTAKLIVNDRGRYEIKTLTPGSEKDHPSS
jgi:glyoxylase-like metal-dependent hydrolase (beta-lactamase superfamily II)